MGPRCHATRAPGRPQGKPHRPSQRRLRPGPALPARAHRGLLPARKLPPANILHTCRSYTFKGKGAAKKEERDAWLEDQLHQLKHKRGAAGRLLSPLDEYLSTTLLKNSEDAKTLLATITYLQNQKGRTNYPYSVERNWPIGGGVTEAACKTLIKHRLCKSGSRWKNDGALAVLSIRALRLTPGRWQEFWRNIDQYGCPTLSA